MEDLLENYPISTLNTFAAAANKNMRQQMITDAQCSAVAVLHGLDNGFNKGKGRILDKFTKKLQKDPVSKKEKRDKFMGFLERHGKKKNG